MISNNSYYLSSIVLHNFRNHKNFFAEFDPYFNLILGPNGAGKTSILEAISLLSMGKTMRGADLDLLIKKNEAMSQVSAVLHNNLGSLSLGASISYNFDTKSLKKNYILDNNIIKNKDYINYQLHNLWLIPQMDNFFLQDSSVKRKFIDKMVSSLDSDHIIRLIKHDKLIKERNKILSYHTINNKWLDAIDEELVAIGVAIVISRVSFLEKLNEYLSKNIKYPIYLSFQGGLEDLLLEYKFSLKVENLYKAELKQMRTYEKNNVAQFGAHKSKLNAFDVMNSQSVSLSSTGEQKLILVEILIAFIKMMYEYKKIKPILLLDEINIHLDEDNTYYVLDAFHKLGNQVFITAVDDKYFSYSNIKYTPCIIK